MIISRTFAALTLSAFVLLPASAQELSSLFGVHVYPAKGQSSSQQANDESVCYKSAKARTGVDPANMPPAPVAQATQQSGGAVRGAARGAAAGAVIGAIAGNAGTGAAIGAASGGMVGFGQQRALNNAAQHYAQANAQAQQSASLNNFRRAFSACLESKGYTVK
ncbi:MAG TPA: glycine zipper family protein [Candidatus Aquilonibacter sp.]